MKALSSSIVLLAGKYSGKVRIVTFIFTLVLFILAAGAPFATGSVGS
jgi:hypothetical protein